MAADYTFLDHTADRRMVITGSSMEELFRQGLYGLARLLIWKEELEPADSKVMRTVHIQASDQTTLLVDFLSEVLTWSHIEHAIFDNIIFVDIDETSLKADVQGYKVKQFAEEVKAVTYHEAEVRRNRKGQWESTIIFDI